MNKVANASGIETRLNKFIIRTSTADSAVIKRRENIPTEEVAQKGQIENNLGDMNDNNAYNKVFNKENDINNDFLRIARKGIVAFLNIFVGLPRAITGIVIKRRITKDITLPRTLASAAQAFVNLFQSKAVEQKSETQTPPPTQTKNPPPTSKDVNQPPIIQEHTTPPTQTKNPPPTSEAEESKHSTTTNSDESSDVEVSKIYGSRLEEMQAVYKNALDKLPPNYQTLVENYKKAETDDERAAAKATAKEAFLEAFNGPKETAEIAFENVIKAINKLCALEKIDQDEQEKNEDFKRNSEELLNTDQSFEAFFNIFSTMRT